MQSRKHHPQGLELTRKRVHHQAKNLKRQRTEKWLIPRFSENHRRMCVALRDDEIALGHRACDLCPVG